MKKQMTLKERNLIHIIYLFSQLIEDFLHQFYSI